VTFNEPAEISVAQSSQKRAYRALSTLAVTSVACGGLSLLVVFDWSLFAIPLAGIALGLLAIRRIRARPDQLAGERLALVGIGLSVALGASGWGWLAAARAAEVPHGYIAVGYADLQPDPDHAEQQIPPKARELSGKKIFIKGYMYPGRQQYGLKKFIISRENGYCKFCTPDPQPTDLIVVTMAGDLETRYTRKLLHLGGKLEVNEDWASGKSGHVLYQLEADYIRW
jgi:hypothetical protein